LRVQPLIAEPLPRGEPLDEQFDDKMLRRRAASVAGALGVVVLVAWLAPGLDDVRSTLEGADPVWLAVGLALEGLSCISYVVMFKPVFCERMSWPSAYDLGMSELAMGSLIPASGAGGLALGAWALRKGGMPALEIARRTVAFFALKSAANFVAVAVLGTLMFAGVGPSFSPLLTILPAGMAVLAILAVVAMAMGLRRRELPIRERSRRSAAIAKAIGALGDGLVEAGEILRKRDSRVIVGSIGYWAFDNAVLWACFKALGHTPALTVILMGYLIGQLGGLLPIPGGIGGIDGGLIGTLVVYGVPIAVAAAAVLAYRLILFWLPLVVGTHAYTRLRRGLQDPNRPDLCDPSVLVQPAPVT
jgi:uncharacterized protein (TIRG00374 family)